MTVFRLTKEINTQQQQSQNKKNKKITEQNAKCLLEDMLHI